jgi:hypothetical protein
MKKRKTIAKLVNECAEILQRIVRIKASKNGYANCVTCGVNKPWQELQGGHFISRVKTAHKLLEENIHPQCGKCNGYLRGNMVAYTLYMEDMYGRDFVEELLATQNQTKKYSRFEIEELKAALKQELTELENKAFSV